MTIQLKNKNFAVSRLASAIGASDTSISVSSGEGSLFPSTGPFRAVIWSSSYDSPVKDANREIVTLQLASGDSFTATRAQESTTARSWAANSYLAHVITAGKVEEIEAEVGSKVDKVGGAAAGNLASFASGGGIQDSGVAASAVGAKMDKVGGATTGNLPSFNSEGGVQDSGVAASSISGKADKVSGSVTNKVAKLDSSGNLAATSFVDSDVVVKSGTPASGNILQYNGSAWVPTAMPATTPTAYVSRDDYSTLAAAVSAAVSAGKALLIPPGTETLSGDTTISSSLKALIVMPGASFAGAYTLTIDCPLVAGRHQIFEPEVTVVMAAGIVEEVFPEWWGARGDGSTNDFDAIGKAIDCAGSSITSLANKQYKVVGAGWTITKNRLTFRGQGVNSSLYWSPTGANQNLFYSNNSLDGLVFQDFQAYHQNLSGYGGAGCFYFTGNVSRVRWHRVLIDGFRRYGIYHDSAMYDKICDCQILRTDNSANGTFLGVGLYFGTFANCCDVVRTQFAQNDKSMRIISGNAVRIIDCCFELEGTTGNAFGITYNIDLTSINGLRFAGNYVEGCKTASGYATIYLEGCAGAIIEGNSFAGKVGSTQHTESFIATNNACKGILVANNVLQEPNAYFFVAASLVEAKGNKYIKSGSEVTAYNSIMALMSGASLVELDVDYTFTFDPASMGNLTGLDSAAQAITGIAAGDKILVAAPYSQDGVIADAYWHYSGNVQVHLTNTSGSTKDLASGTWRLRVLKAR